MLLGPAGHERDTDFTVHPQPLLIEPVSKGLATGHLCVWDATRNKTNRFERAAQRLEDAPERVESLEANVPSKHHIRCRCTTHHRHRTTWTWR